MAFCCFSKNNKPNKVKDNTLKLYGFPISAPALSVKLYLMLTKTPYNYENIHIYKGDQKTERFTRLNPTQQVPTIDDEGFILSEGGAILVYLAESRNNTTYYPECEKMRGKINQYLHYHHTATRKFLNHYTAIIQGN